MAEITGRQVLVVTAGAFAGITFPIVIGQVFSRIGQTQGMFCLSSIACLLAAVFFTVQFKMKKPVDSEFLSANRPETTPELPLGSKPEQVL